LDHYPENYEIKGFSFKVTGHTGENSLTFTGTGTSDGLGAGVTNIQLVRNTVCGKEDAIVNGVFDEPNVGTGWSNYPQVTGWATTNGIEIGHGRIYNSRWPQGKHITELDTNQNTAITQKVYLDHRHRVVSGDDYNSASGSQLSS
jgi:hypothetical protein